MIGNFGLWWLECGVVFFLFFFCGVGKKYQDQSKADPFALVYSPFSKKSRQDPVVSEEYNQKGFGAGGLPPLFYSHLSRNWTTASTSVQAPPSTDLSPSHPPCSADYQSEACHYGPGMGLQGLHPMNTEEKGGMVSEELDSGNMGVAASENESLELSHVESWVEGEALLGEREGEEEEMARKRRRIIPSSQVKQFQGGRGRDRFRLKSKTKKSGRCNNS